jgi:hypothetical protein
MIKYTFSLVIALACASWFIKPEDTNTIKSLSNNGTVCNLQNTTFKSGEKLTFKAFYAVSGIYVTAGELEVSTLLTKYNNKPVYQLKGIGKTLPSYDFIFKVRDYYTSWIDTSTLLPIRFERDVNEGEYTKKQKATFKQDQNKVITDKDTYKTPDCTLDVVSALYACRNIDVSKFKVGDKITFNMYIDEEQFSMYIKYMGKETITTKFGTYKTIRLKPLLLKGNVFNGGENMNMWVTDDKNKIPVRIETPIKVGTVKIDLSSYSGLRHTMTSKIK